MMNKIPRIKELINQLKEACKGYYLLDAPIMTDKEYDKLYDELMHLENETKFILSSSPTQKVQGEVLSSLKKIQHTETMLSADKSKDINDIIKFMGDQECVLSWKLDGLTLVLRYNHGKLQQAITRGGGDEGEDVTHTVKTFSNIPLTIDYKGYLEIRGEGLVSFKDFKIINEELIIQGKDTYESPRNLAAGSVRQLNANITKSRNLIFFAFGIVKCDEWFMHKMNQFMFLKSLGFDVVEHVLVTKNEIDSFVRIFESKLEILPYLTDGLIIEYNDIVYGKVQGSTGHHSKALYAMKWDDDSYETTFRNIELNTTRTGMVSLTAIYDEVDLDGAKNTRASVHNYDIFEEFQFGVGDTLTVYRANGVIPQVEENLTRSGTYKINMECPSCGSKIVIKKPKEARFLFCENSRCPSKLVNKFVHFCSRNAMNIDGLSEAGIELFIDKGFLETFDDLYNLERYKDQIIRLEGWGIKSYNKLIEAINNSKRVKVSNFIYALGIPNIGVNGSKILAKHFNNDWFEFEGALCYDFDFTQLQDFGEITNRSLYDWYSNEDERKMWIRLTYILDFIKEEKKEVSSVSDNPFKGCKVYCTGTFASHKKEELKSILEGFGAEFTSGYAKSLDYLIVGSIKGSSKEDKAKKDGVKILTEGEFIKMIGG